MGIAQNDMYNQVNLHENISCPVNPTMDGPTKRLEGTRPSSNDLVNTVPPAFLHCGYRHLMSPDYGVEDVPYCSLPATIQHVRYAGENKFLVLFTNHRYIFLDRATDDVLRFSMSFSCQDILPQYWIGLTGYIPQGEWGYKDGCK